MTKKTLEKYFRDINLNMLKENGQENNFIFGLREVGDLELCCYDADDSQVENPGEIVSTGTGSSVSYGVLEKEFSTKKIYSVDDAILLGFRAVSEAAQRDVFSGGYFQFSVLWPNWSEHHEFFTPLGVSYSDFLEEFQEQRWLENREKGLF